FCVVMGQSSITFGIALYENLHDLERILRPDVPDVECGRVSSLSLMYGEQHEMAVRDLDAARERGWPIAGPSAYPFTVRVYPGGALRSPLVWELQLVAACLRAVPDFLIGGIERSRISVPPLVEDVEMNLSWIHGIEP